MKPYVVTVYPNDGKRYQGNFITVDRRYEYLYEAWANKIEVDHSHVAFFETEKEADAWVSCLIEKDPNLKIIKSKTIEVFYAEPGPRRSGVFTEKGFVPK